MRGPVRQLLSNLGGMVLALLLAFAIWIAATLQADPFVTAEIANLPISVQNQPPNTVLLQSVTERATVRVRGPQSVLRNFTGSDLTVTLDLSEVKIGEPVTVHLEASADTNAVRVEAVSPAQQMVHLEPVDTITVPVSISIVGEVATGYRPEEPVISPEQVTVTGAQSLLRQVSVVSGTLNVEGAREPIAAAVRVVPRDAKGNAVSNVDWTPEEVEVRVGMRKKLGFRPDVTVIPDLRGDPAPGYRRGSITVEPSTVTLAGLPSVLEELPAFVRTEPISVTGATADLVARTTLTVPNNVVVVGTQFVTVTLEVVPIESSRILTATVRVQGLQPGWVATVSPNVVQAIFVGPDPILRELDPEDVQVIVNLFDYALGVHRLEPVVLAPEGVAVLSVIPETIEVVIAEPVMTPTPPQPTPTPASPR